MKELSKGEVKNLMRIIRLASAEALQELRAEKIMSREDFNTFSEVVSVALDETEREFLEGAGKGDECASCGLREECLDGSEFNIVLDARLVIMANKAAKEEGKTFNEWINNLIVEKLFY